MNAMPLVIAAICILLLAYRFYYGFITAKVIVFNDKLLTPAFTNKDSQNYVPMKKWFLFGHHFAAIAGSGPLIGPVLAAQFGYFPGFLWMLIGAVTAGAMHDFIILMASIKHNGQSIAEIAKDLISKTSGITTSIGLIIIITSALSGLGVVVVNSLSGSVWGTFTVATTIPIALFMGIWIFKIRKGNYIDGTIIGIVLLIFTVVIGKIIPETSIASWFMFDKKTLTIILAIYGFTASVLPVWLLLSPRDYLSSILKIGVIFLLALGVIIVMPELKMPAFTSFIHGGGPIIKGSLFPYLFITIACGAVSGFHSIASSGTTPKMISKESDAKFIGVGAMFVECLVGILALIAASSLLPYDYFKINIPQETFNNFLPQLKAMGLTESNLNNLSSEVGENIAGRPGGAVTLGVGMAYIFTRIPGLEALMSYLYHFAIIFEVLFILTMLDAGTRVGRFILQEAFSKIYKPFGRFNWIPGNILTSSIIVFLWAYFIYTGSVSSIWPMFGCANQLLAVIGLAIGTSYIISIGKIKYVLVTIIPMIFIALVTITAAYDNVFNIYLPKIFAGDQKVPNIINVIMTLIIFSCVIIVLSDAIPRWIKDYKKYLHKKLTLE